MASYKVEICGVNTSKLPLLTEKEKEDLFVRIKNGDKQAREEYIKGNLRLVLSVIKRFSGNTDNIDDLFQIGCIGLMKSIDNFDPNIGVKFITYAVPMMMGEVRRYLRDTSAYHVPRSCVTLLTKPSTPKNYCPKNPSTNQPLKKSQRNARCQKKKSYMLWIPSRHP